MVMAMEKIMVSVLGKTWLLDLDGTILKHNGHLTEAGDCFLDGAQEFLYQIPKGDKIIFLTSRDVGYAAVTEAFLDAHGIGSYQVIYNLPYGERILVNDKKPSGMKTALAVNVERDVFMQVEFVEDKEL